ncbi:MAG: S16 family serine protease, partial [Thermodesulfobacteriota bacterium]|nr:S16 family serine protease [Thermodesulfobacteriota bacterium]
GAIKKDGPSAGVTIVTSIISLLTNTPVQDDLAMTGEITLRGVVLPVGGIKEKVLAAKREDLHHIIIPRINEKDLRDIEGDALKEMHIHLVDNIDDCLRIAFPGAYKDEKNPNTGPWDREEGLAPANP